MFDNGEDFKLVQAVLENIAENHDENRVGVEEAYTQYVGTQPDAELSKKLVELRVRWSPYTITGTVYAEQPEDKEYDAAKEGVSKQKWQNQLKLDAWSNYKRMIHEVVHTAAHPDFKDYLDKLPAYVHNVIDEGTTDYFALQIWNKTQEYFDNFFQESQTFKINNTGRGTGRGKAPKLSESKQNLVALIHSVQKAIAHMTVNAQNLADLSSYRKAAIYAKQEAAIRSMVSIDDGERRLKAAYFYGEVDRFFPPAALFYEEEESERNDEEEGEERDAMEEDKIKDKRKERDEEKETEKRKKLKEESGEEQEPEEETLTTEKRKGEGKKQKRQKKEAKQKIASPGGKSTTRRNTNKDEV